LHRAGGSQLAARFGVKVAQIVGGYAPRGQVFIFVSVVVVSIFN